jgi:hypothetical protein
MTYFRFEATDSDPDSALTKEFQAVHLQDILAEFQYFLKGCGFEFKGDLGIIEEETTETFGHCGSWGVEDISHTGGGVDFDYIYNEPVYNPNLGGFKTSEGL